MSRQEFCGDIIGAMLRNLPPDSGEIARYLQDQYVRYQQHPCFPDVAREIGSIMTTRCSPEEFSLFCRDISMSEPIISQVLKDCTLRIDSRDFEGATSRIRYILPFGQTVWPETGNEAEVRSFRDLVEYTYYMVICEPDREVIIEPYLHTDILYQYGRLLSGMGEYASAIPVLMAAKRESPVHSGILGVLAEVLIKADLPGKTEDIILRSFRTAWLKEDLAHAYRNQGYLFTLYGEYDAAITCYLIAEAWMDSPEGSEELRSLSAYTGKEIDRGYYAVHGREILTAHGIPFGPDPEVTGLLVRIADDYLEEQDLFKAREYLIRAHQLLMSDPLEERIRQIERHLEDMMDF